MKDNDDIIRRGVLNNFMRTNVLVRRFVKCSGEVKLIQFKS